MSKVDEYVLDQMRKANSALREIKRRQEKIQSLQDSRFIGNVTCSHFLLGVVSFLYVIVLLFTDDLYIRAILERHNLSIMSTIIGLILILSVILNLHNWKIVKLYEEIENIRQENMSFISIFPYKYQNYEASNVILNSLEKDKARTIIEAYNLYEEYSKLLRLDTEDSFMDEILLKTNGAKNDVIKPDFLSRLGMAE
ncbi:MAG: hypothetical protein HUJ83_09255 [Veillonella sp.]|nr:hypothetical protein [Veillonella sp.]